MNTKLTSLAVACGLTLALLAAPMSARAAEYDIDPAHTFVLFEVGHLGIGKAHGMFRKTTGTFDPEAGKLNVTIDVASLFTADKKRDDHLKGPDFFNAKQFPKITFVAKKVAKKGDMQRVTGDLTIKGKTKPATIEMKKVGEGKDPWGKFRVGYTGTMTIDRVAFGVDYLPEGVSKDVKLTISVEGVKK